MSCDKFHCQETGNNMILTKEEYCVWLCEKHYEEHLKREEKKNE